MQRNNCKLFVGGLSWITTDTSLRQYFTNFGHISDCAVMKDETGKSRGFGFLTLTNQGAAETILHYSGHRIDGRKVDVKQSDPFACPKKKMGTNSARIFLGGLPSDVTETEIRAFFEPYGTVTDAVIIVKDDKRQKGFGFVSFKNEDAVKRLVAQHYVQINDKQVEIKSAEPRQSDKVLLQPFYKESKPTTCASNNNLMLFSDDESDSDDSALTVIAKY